MAKSIVSVLYRPCMHESQQTNKQVHNQHSMLFKSETNRDFLAQSIQKCSYTIGGKKIRKSLISDFIHLFRFCTSQLLRFCATQLFRWVHPSLHEGVSVRPSLGLSSRAKGIADHYWPRAVFLLYMLEQKKSRAFFGLFTAVTSKRIELESRGWSQIGEH